MTSELEQAQRERDEALRKYEPLHAAWLAEHKETCVHHTDTERKAAGCPVCRSRHATAKINEGLEGAALLGLQTVESVIQQGEELQARCAKLEAACAEMREALEYCGCHEHTESPCDESGSHYKDLCEFCQKVDKALSTTCGQAFLDERERTRKALEKIINVSIRGCTCERIAREALNIK